MVEHLVVAQVAVGSSPIFRPRNFKPVSRDTGFSVTLEEKVMTESPSLLEYAYTHVQTEATTGYFSCEPQGLDETQALLLLESRPWDDFLHLHCLRLLYEKNVAE